MDRPITYKVFQKTIPFPLEEKDLYCRLSSKVASVPREDTLERILDRMRKAKKLTLRVGKDAVPNEILEELRWLEYYGFVSSIIRDRHAEGNYDFNQFRDVTTETVTQSMLTVIDGELEHCYVFQPGVREILWLHSLSSERIHGQNGTNEDCLLLPENWTLDLGKVLGSFPTFFVVRLSATEPLSSSERNVAYCESGTDFRDPIVMISNRCYRIQEVLSRPVLVECGDWEDLASLYIPCRHDEPYLKHVRIKDRMIPLAIDQSTSAVMLQVAPTMMDYLQSNVVLDVAKLQQEYAAFGRIDLSIRLYPPMLMVKDGFNPSKQYDTIRSMAKKIHESLEVMEMVDWSDSLGKLAIGSFHDSLLDRYSTPAELPSFLWWLHRMSTMLQTEGDAKRQLENRYLSSIKALCNDPSDSDGELGSMQNRIPSFEDLYLGKEVVTGYVDVKHHSLRRVVGVNDEQKTINEEVDTLCRMVKHMSIIVQTIYGIRDALDHFQLPHLGMLYENQTTKCVVVRSEWEVDEAHAFANPHQLKVKISVQEDVK